MPPSPSGRAHAEREDLVTNTQKLLIVLAVMVVAAGFLAFTSPGHSVRAALGFATADPCAGSNC
jgi:hypothetical protein